MLRRVLIITPRTPRASWLTRWREARYAAACARHAVQQGDAPFTSALPRRTGVERMTAYQVERAWAREAACVIMYDDHGITEEMKRRCLGARDVACRSLRSG